MSYPKIMLWLGELCLYMALPGFILSRFGAGNCTAPTIFIMLAIEILCYFLRERTLLIRMLPLLLFIPLFMTDIRVLSLLFLIPPALLFGMRSYQCNWGFDRELMRLLLRSSITGYVLVTLYCASIYIYSEMISFTFIWFLSWLLLAVLGMRLCRASNEENRSALPDILLLLGSACFCFLISQQAVLVFLARMLGILYQYIFGPVIILLVAIILAIPAFLLYLSNLLTSLIGFQKERIPADEIVETVREQLPMVEYVAPDWLRWALISLGVLLFAYIAYCVLRHVVHYENTTAKGSAGIERERIYEKEISLRDKPSRSSRQAREINSIRAHYRKYLKLCAARGTDVSGALASDVILKKSGEYLDSVKASELRSLWLKARYDPQYTDTSDVHRAARLSAEISRTARPIRKKDDEE